MRIKYPRTFHLPWSLGRTCDDKVLQSIEHLLDLPYVVSLKKDGECTSLYSDGFHARSLDSRHHPSRDWLKRFHAGIAHNIPAGWRVCGENVYARHSIAYTDLPSYFLGFSIWDDQNMCLGWDDTLEWFELIGITPVEELWRGHFNEPQLRRLAKRLDLGKEEGYVVRPQGAFHYDDFGQRVAKFVRKSHVQTDAHWMHQAVVPNQLAEVAETT